MDLVTVMALPSRRTGASSPSFGESPFIHRFNSEPGDHRVFPTKNSPRSKKRRSEILTSTNPSSATSKIVATKLVSWNEASINTAQTDVHLLFSGSEQLRASRTPSPTPKKLHQYSSQDVAEMLTLVDAELLRRIEPSELQNGAWMKKDEVG